MKCYYGRWLIWAQTEQEQIPTTEFDLEQVKIQKWESKLVQKWGPNQRINVRTLSPINEV